MPIARIRTMSVRLASACIAAMLLAVACAYDYQPAATNRECVVLLHGLARTSVSMLRLENTLVKHGYYVANVSYPSREYPIEVLAPAAIRTGLAECRKLTNYTKMHFVTHSLGGILVRYHTVENEIDKLGRVVMLAPPNQGSNAVDALARTPGFDWLNGPAGYQLGKGEDSIPLQLDTPEFDFAVIAGNRTIDPITSAVLDNPDDGRVSVEDTKLEGMRDFVVVPVSHAMIMQDREVIRLVMNYLAFGRFEPGDEQSGE